VPSPWCHPTISGALCNFVFIFPIKEVCDQEECCEVVECTTYVLELCRAYHYLLALSLTS
jgi:hypothetical protein